MSLTITDLFCGAGGSSLGAELERFVEREAELPVLGEVA